MKKTTWTYKFSCINPTDYELRIFIPIESVMLKKIFLLARKQMLRKHGMSVPDKLDSVDNFMVPNRYHNLIGTYTASQRKKLSDIFNKDGIMILDSRIYTVFFEKKTEDSWQCSVTYVGEYAKKI